MAKAPTDNFHHVRDFPFFELPRGWGEEFSHHGHSVWGIPLPEIAGLQITKFMVLQVLAGLLTALVFWGLARKVGKGGPTQGRFWNFWETIALYVRDEVVRPTIGDGHHGHDDHHGDGHDHAPHAADSHAIEAGHYADKYLPFIWTCFFYVLFCNLLGAIPMMGSPTGAISMTMGLAAVVFAHNLFHGIKQFGFVGFWANQCPPMDVPGFMKVMLVPLVWALEVVGLCIKHVVLGIRLFANLMGGHTVLGVMLSFIAADAIQDSAALWGAVTVASIFGQVAIGLLELFVAFLQAYVFSFLATMFLSTCLHAH